MQWTNIRSISTILHRVQSDEMLATIGTEINGSLETVIQMTPLWTKTIVHQQRKWMDTISMTSLRLFAWAISRPCRSSPESASLDYVPTRPRAASQVETLPQGWSTTPSHHAPRSSSPLWWLAFIRCFLYTSSCTTTRHTAGRRATSHS